MSQHSLKPGIYFNLPFEEYWKDPALSQSGIKKLLESPLDYWYNSWMNPKHEFEVSQALKIGKAFHTLLLEPEKFRYEIKKGVQSSRIEGMLGEGEYEDMKEAITRLKLKPKLNALFKNGYREVTMVWKDEETGLMCKCRHDYLRPEFSTDYKTISDISKWGVARGIADNGYDIQAAWYTYGMRAKKREGKANYTDAMDEGRRAWLDAFSSYPEENFVFLFQRKDPPCRLKGIQVDKGIIDLGYEKCRRGLEIYKQCYEKYGTKEWSDEESEIEVMSVEDLPQRVFYQ